MLLVEEGIEDHAVDEALRLVHFLLAAVELHPNFLLALVHLFAQIIHGLLQHLEDVYRTIEVSYLAAHCYQHRPHKNPHFLLHFLRLDERHVEVHLLELQRILGVLLGVGVSGFVGRGLVMLGLESFSVLFWQSSSAAFAIFLIPSQRSYLSLQLFYAILEVGDPLSFLSEAHFLFRLSFFLSFLDAFALLSAFPLLTYPLIPVLRLKVALGLLEQRLQLGLLRALSVIDGEEVKVQRDRRVAIFLIVLVGGAGVLLSVFLLAHPDTI